MPRHCVDCSVSGPAIRIVGVAAVFAIISVGTAAGRCGCTAHQQAAMFWPAKAKDSSSSDSNVIRIDDMLIPIEDFESASASDGGSKASLAAQSSDYITCRRLWPDGLLYYRFSDYYSSVLIPYKNLIRQALDRLESETGRLVRFIELNSNITSVAYVNIISGSGCWSYVGKVQHYVYSDSRQDLSLMVPDCMEESTIQHEFIHALGFYHEQSRVDRDSYVSIQWSNIFSGSCSNFFRDSFLIPSDFPGYDYSSVMHYPSFAQTCNSSQPTIVKIGGGLINETNNLSASDVSKLAYAYSASNLAKCRAATSSGRVKADLLLLFASTLMVKRWLSVVHLWLLQLLLMLLLVTL